MNAEEMMKTIARLTCMSYEKFIRVTGYTDNYYGEDKYVELKNAQFYRFDYNVLQRLIDEK